MRRLTICLLTVSALAWSVLAHQTGNLGIVGDVRQVEGLPCYVVISNEVGADVEWRRIRILTDKNDVNERELVKLHQYFSAMYSDIERLSVKVNTSLNFLLGNYTTGDDTEALRAALAGLPYERKRKVWEKDAQGILMRTGNVEQFGYKAEGGDIGDMKYVLVKGEDPSCRNCKILETGLPEPRSGGVVDFRKSQDGIPCYFEFGNFMKDDRWFIGLFINAEDANEANLRALLRHFSRQYPQHMKLAIRVYTNLKQLHDFALKELGDYVLPAMEDYFVAAIFRDSDNMVIRYRHPHQKITTIVVQGTDIFPDIDRGSSSKR